MTSALLGTGSYSNYTPATALGTGTGTAGQRQAKLAKPGGPAASWGHTEPMDSAGAASCC